MTSKPQNILTINYKVIAHMHKLKLNKSSNFQTRLMWKRNQNKAETKTVTHTAGISTYDQSLSLEFGMYFDKVKNCFVEKLTEILPVVITESGLKSGGSVRVDIAEALNNKQLQIFKKLTLNKCPDPEGFIQVTFSYQRLQQKFDQEMSTLNSSMDTSMMNSSMLQESHIVDRNIENVLPSDITNKIESIKIQKKTDKAANDIGKIQQLQKQNSQLKKRIETLQNKLQFQEVKYQNQKQELQKKLLNLQKTIDKKCKEISEKSNLISKTQKLSGDIQIQLKKRETQIQELQKKLFQLENSRDRHQINFEQVEFSADFAKQFNNEEKQRLQRQNVDLQNKVALSSIKMAELFNAAFQIGGANLLDKLQSSIGLIQ